MSARSMRSQAAGCCNTDSSSCLRTTLEKLCMVHSETMTPARDEYDGDAGCNDCLQFSMIHSSGLSATSLWTPTKSTIAIAMKIAAIVVVCKS